MCVGGRVILLPCSFSLNNSETVKAIALALSSSQWHFIRDTCTKFNISNLPSLQILGITQTGVFLISRFWVQENCHNSRTSNDIDMNLGPVTKIDKRNKTKSKNWQRRHVRNLLYHCLFSNLWPLWNNPEVSFRMPSFIFSLIGTLYLTKTENRVKKISSTALTLLVWVKVLVSSKKLIFYKKMLITAKLKEPRY